MTFKRTRRQEFLIVACYEGRIVFYDITNRKQIQPQEEGSLVIPGPQIYCIV